MMEFFVKIVISLISDSFFVIPTDVTEVYSIIYPLHLRIGLINPIACWPEFWNF